MERSLFLTAIYKDDVDEIKRLSTSEPCPVGEDISSTTGHRSESNLTGGILSMKFDGGDTALMLAVRKGKMNCVKYLTDQMSPSMLNHKNEAGETALLIAALPGTDTNSLFCLEYLINAGADLDVESKEGNTALMLSLEMGSPNAVTLLLKRGASVKTISQFGNTPLTLAFYSETFFGDLLRRGLDPTLSRRGKQLLQEAVLCQKFSVVRALVMNGFPPLDIPTLPHYLPPLSPLAAAICFRRPRIAKYLIRNRFFTRYDLLRLCRDPVIRETHEDVNMDVSDPEGECSQILDLLSARPQPLKVLCLITTSSALSQDFATDPLDTVQGKDKWMCQPTFRERVDRLEIPPSLKRELLHKTPWSTICCASWEDIRIGQERRFLECHCESGEAGCEKND
ncbi:ankyrin repeat family protein [Elysia marginata]|uniref:Ankyrin repeat family protein n=1 Tax=Elysia marginata TaxID=1093978 RepID=A0AAV4F7J7_9GAST|nr:ankyrin repeat family protein [Elysia marginata]